MGELPKTVKTFGVTYTVRTREMDGRYGHCDYQKCELVVDAGHDIQRQKKTLVHEIVHAFLNEGGLNEINNEKIVEKLEAALYDLLKNNDFSWLRTAKKGTK